MRFAIHPALFLAAGNLGRRHKGLKAPTIQVMPHIQPTPNNIQSLQSRLSSNFTCWAVPVAEGML